MSAELSLKKEQEAWHGSLRSYLIGFIGSLIFTTISFGLVMYEVLPGETLVFTITGLALAQAAIQLIYFLNLGKEGSPHWETIIFGLMFLILLIIAGGSLWIMYDLDQRMGHEKEMMNHD